MRRPTPEVVLNSTLKRVPSRGPHRVLRLRLLRHVYAGHGTPGQDEGSALLPALAGDVIESMQTYGQAKVACEQHVLRAFGPDRALIARVGIIGGPGDIFDRSGYWPLRFARPSTKDGARPGPGCSRSADPGDRRA